jgi:hypothetical protein
MWKKYMLAYLAYVSFFFCALVMEACVRIDCGGNSSQSKLISINSSLKRIIGVIHSASTEDLMVEDHQSGGSIRYDSVGLNLEHILTIAMNNKPVGVSSMAYACEPDITYQILTDISVTSTGNYNVEFPSGSNLKSIVGFHPAHTKTPYSAQDFLGQAPVGPVPILLKFNLPPAENGIHQFTVLYTLSDGTTVQTIVDPVFITK